MHDKVENRAINEKDHADIFKRSEFYGCGQTRSACILNYLRNKGKASVRTTRAINKGEG